MATNATPKSTKKNAKKVVKKSVKKMKPAEEQPTTPVAATTTTPAPVAEKPSALKTKKGKLKAAKEAVERIVKTPRERYLDDLCEKHNLKIPPVEQMFASQIKEGLEPVDLTKLAVFCNSTSFMNSKGKLAAALNEVTEYFGDINFLNLSAEIDPKNVEKVIIDLLEEGSLTHEVKCALIENVTIEKIDRDRNPHVNQVWDGRHRTVAFAIIYGPNAVIYPKQSTLNFDKALRDCVRSNDTRAIKKVEAVHFQGLKDGDDPVAAYARKKGNLKKIAQWIVSQVRENMVPNPCLKVLDSVNICEKVKGEKGITIVNFTNVIINALSQLGSRYESDRLDKKTKDLFNLVTSVFKAVYHAIDSHSGGKKTSLAWNAYSSIVMGKIIGRAIDYWLINKQATKENIDTFANNLAAVVCGYMDSASDTYAQNPQGKLEPQMLMFADQKLGIILPRVEVDMVESAE